MITWLILDTEPRRAFYAEPAARALIDAEVAHPWLVGVGTLRRPMAIPGVRAGEAPNCTVRLDNSAGQLTTLWADDPPIRAVARILGADGELFAGVVTDIDLAADASITIQAGFVRPMSDRMPLRSTTEWGEYEDVRTIPVAYGRVTLAPIPYDAEGRVWVLSDGAIAGVDAVTVEGTPVLAWAFRNGVDRAGRTVAFLELANPVGQETTMAVAVRGRVHPDRGHLMILPDEILWDVFTNVCGLGIAPAQLDAFRSEVVGLEIGGVLDDAEITIRAQIDQIMQSLGAAWSVAADGIAALWPFVDDNLTPTTVEADWLSIQGLRPEAHQAGLRNVLRIKYDYDWAAGRHTHTIQAEDAESIRRYGRIEAEWDARWLRLERQAVALGARLVPALAYPRWTVTWTAPDLAARPGDWAYLADPSSPVIGRHRLLDVAADPARLTATLVVEAAASMALTITRYRATEAGDRRATEDGRWRSLEP